MPFCGRSFYGVPSSSPVAPGLPGYQVAFDAALTNQQGADSLMPTARRCWPRVGPVDWDGVAQTSYAYDAASRVWVSSDSAQAVRAKAAYIMSKGLAGAMVWALGLDDASL